MHTGSVARGGSDAYTSRRCVREWRRRGNLTVCLMVKLRFRLGLATEKPLAYRTSR